MSTRFARVVGQAAFKDFDGLPAVLSADVVKLLQREHAAVRRKVKGMYPAPDDAEVFEHGYRQACIDLLAWLDERGR